MRHALVPLRFRHGEWGKPDPMTVIGKAIPDGTDRWTPAGWIREVGPSRLHLAHASRVLAARIGLEAQQTWNTRVT